MNWNQLGTPLEEQAYNSATTDFEIGSLGDENNSLLFNNLNNNIYNFNLTNSGSNFGFNTIDYSSLPDLSFNIDSNNNTVNNNNSFFYQPLVSSQTLQQLPLQQNNNQQQQVFQPYDNNSNNNHQQQSTQPNHYSIDYSQPNDIVSGPIFSIDGQLHNMQQQQQQQQPTSDYSSPMDHTSNVLSSPSMNIPSTPTNAMATTVTTTTNNNVSSPATASPTSSNEDADDSDSSADESDQSDSERANRPSKKRKNSFDPNFNYGPVLPKNIQLEISSKEFEAYRVKFFSGKISKDVASSLKSQERESAQKSRERKSRNLQDLEEKLKEENVKTSNLEAKLKEASIKNNYLEEEIRRLKAELRNNNNNNHVIAPQPYFNDSCASSSSSSSSLSSFLSIGAGIPTVAGGQRLACFFLLFLVILFTNSPYNGYYGVSSASNVVRSTTHPFQASPYFGRSTFSIPTKDQLEMVKPFNNVIDSRYVYDWQGKSNGEITISYNPNNANNIIKNVLDKPQNNNNMKLFNNNNNVNNDQSRKTTTTTTTTTTTSSTSMTAPATASVTEPQIPTLPSSQHEHFHSTHPDSESTNGEICDIPQLPNNSSVKISIRSNYKITSPDGSNNHSIPSSHDESMVGQHGNEQQQFNYKELNVDVELLFPSRIFENGSNEISKLLMSANNGQPLKIVASVLDLDSASSSSSTQQQQQQQPQKQEPTFSHKHIDNLD
ncbi:hypothetical protein PPL_09799 [Heterostelium album PN500]|uniref:BZIP domain-containing protein n=1 Tax=Heterostelium pallidum (strain ATCC 26659 / Pp 5 / PN500) TaxID=670386 RepID=D3BP36_HETP5|nr:hypothetical protein PPL_09799 [Heterostelium album PN500]EFA77046.1 hypothetical protein PPL_09799 [Heterostelium album PN500]|eukprot:XP_020429176.1 hypothetical protein PPL_09799 [Heterostelium album PN500]